MCVCFQVEGIQSALVYPREKTQPLNLIWLQCAEFNPEEDHPKSQDVHVGTDFADLSARISVPPSVYDSYGGRMAIESENYLVSDQSLRGNQTWVWSNKANTKQCRGVDHIIGLLGRCAQTSPSRRRRARRRAWPLDCASRWSCAHAPAPRRGGATPSRRAPRARARAPRAHRRA